jgi:Co/Zn/Cd efflux system component
MGDSCCQGELDARALQSGQRRVLTWVLAINVITFLMMVAGSVLSGSSSLLSGTLDNFGDALTYALSLAVIGAAGPTKARVAFLKGLLILAAAFAVAIQISWRITHLEACSFSPRLLQLRFKSAGASRTSRLQS